MLSSERNTKAARRREDDALLSLGRTGGLKQVSGGVALAYNDYKASQSTIAVILGADAFKVAFLTIGYQNRNIVRAPNLFRADLERAWTVAFAVALSLILVSSVSAATQPLLTTSLTPGTPVQTTFQGLPAVAINYTDYLSGSTFVLVWLTVHNSLGQTVGNLIATAGMTDGQTLPFKFVVSGLASGQYTGYIFAVTASGVPISVTSPLSISI